MKVREGRLNATSINACLRTLAAIMEQAVEYGHVDRNPAKGRRRRLPAVKPRRTYNSESRLRKAAENRAAVLNTAQQMFLEGGYAAVSIPAIANGAGVSSEFIYKAFGPKPELLKAVFDRSVTGDDEPIAVQERPAIQRLAALTDLVAIIDGYTDFLGELHEAVGHARHRRKPRPPRPVRRPGGPRERGRPSRQGGHLER